MHHFGEDMTTGRIVGKRFIVEARHHTTPALITMSGPIEGILTDPQQIVDEVFIEKLALEFAHFLRVNLDFNPAEQARAPFPQER